MYIYIYAIMKIMYCSDYHHKGFVAIHAIGHMIAYLIYDIYLYIYIFLYYNWTNDHMII